ncbi:FAD-dependent oxidoreductase [Paractinoplanes durhamensis]|uniref:N-methyltryptophan oxidase n=1 Tax=Paractinoplanes durhamensis TaxID=113563 RepID=A0ABQ3YY48_9ACTN|nr:FAD-dependent oxidoreductase [Actinoplanes durhamensis]GIE02508.1 N-methyltryptophan oxidase [Actinoplanes durhamensis]
MRIAVVGAGLAGSATAWRLAQRGAQVTLLERATPANPQGSSHGSARIFRYAYPDPFYAKLVVEAREHWSELEDATGATFFRKTGALDFGAVRDPHQLAGVLTEAGVDHELLAAEEAAERWPGIRVDGPVLWHPAAGVIDAQAAVLAMTELARAAGATVHENWTVTAVVESGGRVSVRSADGDELTVDHVVLAAGGWLPELMPAVPVRVRQEQAFHFPYRDPAEAQRWPTFVHKRAGMSTYSLPGGRDADHRGQKVAEYFGGSEIASASANDGIVDPGNRQRLVDYVVRHLPGLIPEPYAETTCVFTCTADENFVIDTVGAVTVASPCSGHGAKFAPLLGAIIADAATGRARPAAKFRLPSAD